MGVANRIDPRNFFSTKCLWKANPRNICALKILRYTVCLCKPYLPLLLYRLFKFECVKGNASVKFSCSYEEDRKPFRFCENGVIGTRYISLLKHQGCSHLICKMS